MKHASRKLVLQRETLAPLSGADLGAGGETAPPRSGGLRASSRACIRASAYSVASAATAISTYLITRGC